LTPEHKFTPSYVIPSLANRHFTGRDDTLEALRQRLFIQSDSQKVALFGLGGIGKTQVALELADWVKKSIPECSIFWVSALSLESFERAYSQIAKKLNIRQSSDDNTMDLVCQHLSSEAAGRWFLIVDNADDADLLFSELEEYIPAGENGTILLTTRSPDVAVSFAQTDTIGLQKMTPEEATIFLSKVVREDLLYDTKSTAQLLEELFMLPLAITQAASYMSRLGISTSRYLEIMHKTEMDRANLASRDFHDNTRYPKSSNAVATTWFISFDQIKRLDPLAAEILGFLAYIEPKAIPRSLLPSLKSEEEMEFAIGTLCGYAFLTKRDDNSIFDMHGLVQLSTRLWLKEQGQEKQAIESAIRRMEGCFPSDDYTNREIWRAYLPHALQILGLDEDRDIRERYLLLYQIAYCVSADGRKKDAVGYFEEVNAWLTRQPEDHIDRLMCQHKLARAYLGNGQIKKAVELLEHVVAVQEKTLDADHSRHLTCQHTLAKAYQQNGQIKQAIELFEHVVAVQEKTLDAEHPYQLISQEALAKAYRKNGQVKQAIELLEHVVAVQERTLGAEHPHKLISQHSLARTYQENGQIKQAIELLEHVVAVQERTLGAEHPHQLIAQHSLAIVYQENGRPKEAVELLEHVVAVEEVTLARQPHRLKSQYALAKAYHQDGQFKRAVELLEHVVAVKETTLTGHPDQLKSQHALARAYHKNGQFKRAVELLEHVVAVEETTLTGHSDHFKSQHALAKAYRKNGQIQQAVELLEHVVAVRERTLGENHPSLVRSQRKLAKAYRAARSDSGMDHSK
jgi:tetratricopeptide (TPR) repeat protein